MSFCVICVQEHLIPGAYKFDALITTFEMILSDCPELREISWRCVIIDEAHRLKNRNCKLLDSLKMLDLVSTDVLSQLLCSYSQIGLQCFHLCCHYHLLQRTYYLILTFPPLLFSALSPFLLPFIFSFISSLPVVLHWPSSFHLCLFACVFCGFLQEHKVLLTGTPLQNTVEELFSLLHFLEPAQFPSETEFLRDFGDLKTEEQV